MNTGIFIGSLETESSALFGAIRRKFDEKSSKLIERAYSYAISHGAIDDPYITREEGVSFNPLPARLALILFNEAKEISPDTISAAILSAVPQASRPSDADFGDAVEICLQADKFDEGSEPLSEIAEAVSLARLLDVLRHLHMSNRSKKEIENEALRASKIAERSRFESNRRLCELARSAYRRYLPENSNES